jgi:short-subunit dehydrogenase
MTKVVVITGASSGIGHATAHAFAEQGARLVLCARGGEALARVAEECRARGGDALVAAADVTDAAALKSVAQQAVDTFGRIDVWINNAGVGAVGRFEETPIEAHRRVIETNLIGHLNGAHAALTHFRRAGEGTLINVISIGGWLSAPYAAAYSASKFALRGFGQALRSELSDSPAIHVCDVYPGFVDTPGISHGANFTGRTLRPLPPLLKPETVAARLVTLATHPQPIVAIGSAAWMGRFTREIAPELRGRLMRPLVDFALSRARSAPATRGNLFDQSVGHGVSGGFKRSHKGLVLAAGAVASAVTIAFTLSRVAAHARAESGFRKR